MRRIAPIIALVMIILLMIVLAASTPTIAAQEATVEAAPVAIVTDVAPIESTGGTVINIESPTETPAAPVDPTEPWYAKYLAQFAILGTLVVGAVAALNRWLEATKVSAAGMTGIEWLFGRTPDVLRKLIITAIKEFVRLGGNLEDVLKEVEDGVPYAAKPHVPQHATPTTYTVTPTSNLPQDGM